MRVLGIDPGTLNMGYGILDEGDDVPILVHCGVLKAFPRDPLANRLQKLYNSLTEILFHYSPNQVAIEEPFVHRNVRSAMMLGGAKAIALLGAVNAGAGIFEYTPRQVKQSVTSYGGSDKKQVQEMVRLQLGLSYPPEPLDASDALAVALCHIQQNNLNRILEQ